MVPIPLDMPIRILAYLGAISRWLTLKPDMAKPLKATPMDNAVIPWVIVCEYAIIMKNVASIPKPGKVCSYYSLSLGSLPQIR